jgi:hypothetical protein
LTSTSSTSTSSLPKLTPQLSTSNSEEASSPTLETMAFEGENPVVPTLNPIGSTLNITNVRHVLEGGYEIDLPTRRLPLPGTQGVPCFIGNNISQFLQEYEEMCEDFSVREEIAKTRFYRYVHPLYVERVKALPEYYANMELSGGTWDKESFYKALKEEFRESDWETLRYSTEYLEILVEWGLKESTSTKEYVDEFHRVSGALKDMGRLEETHQCKLFLRGLKEVVRNRVIRESKYDSYDLNSQRYEKLYGPATKAYRAEEAIHRYDRANDPTLAKKREQHLGTILLETPSNSQTGSRMPYPPSFEKMGMSTRPVGATPLPTMETARRTSQYGVDDLVAQFGKLSVNQNIITASVLAEILEKRDREAREAAERTKQEYLDELKRVASRLEGQQSSGPPRGPYNPGYSNYGGRGGGYRRGGGRGGGFGGNSAIWQGPPAGAEDMTYPPPQDPHDTVVIGGNAVGFQTTTNDRYCYGCFGRDKNGALDPECSHRHSDSCPLINDLINHGCCHKAEGKICIGPWVEGKPSQPIFLDYQRPWYSQIIAHVSGGPHDYNRSRREFNAQRQSGFVKEASQTRAQAYPSGDSRNTVVGGGSLTIGPRDVLRGDDTRVTIGGHAALFEIDGEDEDALLDLFEDLPGLDDSLLGANNASLSVRAAHTKSAKKDKLEKSKKTFRERAKEEEKLPRPKVKRPIATRVTRQTSVPQDMDIDVVSDASDDTEVGHEREKRTEERSQTLEFETFDEEELTPAVPKPKKYTRAPPIPTKYKGLNRALRSSQPVESFMEEFEEDFKVYRLLFELAGAVQGKMQAAIDLVDPTRGIGPLLRRKDTILKGLERMRESDEDDDAPFATGRGAHPVLNVASAGIIDTRRLLKNRIIIPAPRCWCVIMGPDSVEECICLIDTGAECSICPTSLARDLGAKIFDVPHFKMSTATGHEYAFGGMAMLEVEIAHGVGCKTVFFLVDNAPKILLGQPFIAAMKMKIIYHDDGSWDGKFTHPLHPRSTVTVMIVPKSKEAPRIKFQTQKKRRPWMQPTVISEEESDESDYISEN